MLRLVSKLLRNFAESTCRLCQEQFSICTMDNKAYIAGLATQLGIDINETARLSEALSDVIREACAEGEAVAVPGFGTFDVEKHDEYVVTDPTNGRRLLMPPSVSLHFKPSSQLKKSVRK